MAKQPDPNILPALYGDLNSFGQNGDYEKAIKIANRILKEFPQEDKALKCKAVCLLHTAKFEEAYYLLENYNGSEDTVFEKAYCLYRLNKFPESLKTLQSISSQELKVKELKAQILYRLEKYEECFDVYRDIIKNTSDDYDDERETNLSAVIASLKIAGNSKVSNYPTIREDTYELCYNSACSLMGEGKLSEAEGQLRKAEALCRTSLEEDELTEEEIDQELGIIRVQLGYILQILGREKEAQNMYSLALRCRPSDIGLIAVASNNLATLNRDQNVFDTKKKLKSATAEGLEFKLNSKQREIIAMNNSLFLLANARPELCRESISQLKTQYPASAVRATLLEAALLFKEGKANEASKVLDKLASSNPGAALTATLARVQLLLQVGDTMSAIAALSNLNEKERYRLGVISSLVNLHISNGDRNAAAALLKQATQYHKKQKTQGHGISQLWEQAAEFHIKGGDPIVAAASLEELKSLNPNDPRTLARLVLAYCRFDPAKASATAKLLPAAGSLLDGSGVDVDALEAANWAMGLKYAKKTRGDGTMASPKSGGTPGADLLKTKRKRKSRKRLSRLPKHYDPTYVPDPERWLPRKERAGYKKKKDRRGRDIGKGTQGSSAGTQDLFDISKGAAGSKPTGPTTANIKTTPTATTGQFKKQQLKKKKKGGKF